MKKYEGGFYVDFRTVRQLTEEGAATARVPMLLAKSTRKRQPQSLCMYYSQFTLPIIKKSLMRGIFLKLLSALSSFLFQQNDLFHFSLLIFFSLDELRTKMAL